MVWVQVFGYRKLSRSTGEVVDIVELDMPAVEYLSHATWVHVPQDLLARLRCRPGVCAPLTIMDP